MAINSHEALMRIHEGELKEWKWLSDDGEVKGDLKVRF
jgi:hypothetical protein